VTTKKADQALTGEGRIFRPLSEEELASQSSPVGLTAAAPGGIANGSKLLLMDYLFGAVAPAVAAATYYFGLVTGTYTGGTSDISLLQAVFTNNPEVTTAAWTNYARVGLANTIAAATFAAATAAATTQVTSKTTAGAISFTGNATVTGTGPTPTGWFITTVGTGAPTAAQMIATGNLTSGSVAVVNGAAVSFAAGALTLTLT